MNNKLSRIQKITNTTILMMILLLIVAFLLIMLPREHKTDLSINDRNVYTAKDTQGKEQFAFSVSAPIQVSSSEYTIDPKQAFSTFSINKTGIVFNLPSLSGIPDNAKITFLTSITDTNYPPYIQITFKAQGSDKIIKASNTPPVSIYSTSIYEGFVAIKNSDHWNILDR